MNTEIFRRCSRNHLNNRVTETSDVQYSSCSYSFNTQIQAIYLHSSVDWTGGSGNWLPEAYSKLTSWPCTTGSPLLRRQSPPSLWYRNLDGSGSNVVLNPSHASLMPDWGQSQVFFIVTAYTGLPCAHSWVPAWVTTMFCSVHPLAFPADKAYLCQNSALTYMLTLL